MTLERDINDTAERGWNIRLGPSDMVAFAVGALLIVAGLLTFLYYDGHQLGRNGLTENVKALRFDAPAQPVRNIVTRPQPTQSAER